MVQFNEDNKKDIFSFDLFTHSKYDQPYVLMVFKKREVWVISFHKPNVIERYFFPYDIICESYFDDP